MTQTKTKNILDAMDQVAYGEVKTNPVPHFEDVQALLTLYWSRAQTKEPCRFLSAYLVAWFEQSFASLLEKPETQTQRFALLAKLFTQPVKLTWYIKAHERSLGVNRLPRKNKDVTQSWEAPFVEDLVNDNNFQLSVEEAEETLHEILDEPPTD